MSTQSRDLSKVIDDLRQIIVGKVAMPNDQIEQITLFLFLKQLSNKHDDLVRLSSKSDLIFTKEWQGFHFDNLLTYSGPELVQQARDAIESLYLNPNIDETIRKVFDRSYLRILDSQVLSDFLKHLNNNFTADLDLGDFYESLLPILGNQNELGQFRTSRHIIDFIVDVVDPQLGETVVDPACGTAGFLVSAFRHVYEKNTDSKGRLKLNPDQIKTLYNDMIFGWDMEPQMVKFSLANLYLHGMRVPNVTEKNSLENENLWEESCDVIVANPPFITPKGGARRHAKFTIKSNKTEVLFSEWIIRHLNFSGRTGFIVPDGIVFDSSGGHRELRKMLVDNGLWAVVSLPSMVFMPYSGVKTTILFLDKTIKPKSILFYKIENHGFSLNQNPYPVDENDLPDAADYLKKASASFKLGKSPNSENPAVNLFEVSKILEDKNISLVTETYLRDSSYVSRDFAVTIADPALKQELKDLFAKRDGWRKCTLNDVAEWTSGGTPKAKTRAYYGGDIPWVVIGDLNEDIVHDTEKFITEEGVKNSSAKVLEPGTIMFAMYGSIGKTGIMGKRMATNQAIACATPKVDVIDPYFLFFYLQGQRDYFLRAGQGGTQSNISQTIIKAWKINLPDLETQKRVVEIIRAQRGLLKGLTDQAESKMRDIEGIVSTFSDR
jgi:type I restriction enzyme M protein